MERASNTQKVNFQQIQIQDKGINFTMKIRPAANPTQQSSQQMICLDWDNTVIDGHMHNKCMSRANNTEQKPEALDSSLTIDEIKKIMKNGQECDIKDIIRNPDVLKEQINKAHEAGIPVAIVSHSSFPNAIKETLEEFLPEIANDITIATCALANKQKIDKSLMIDEIRKIHGVEDKKNAVLIDDDIANINNVEDAGYQGIHAPTAKALREKAQKSETIKINSEQYAQEHLNDYLKPMIQFVDNAVEQEKIAQKQMEEDNKVREDTKETNNQSKDNKNQNIVDNSTKEKEPSKGKESIGTKILNSVTKFINDALDRLNIPNINKIFKRNKTQENSNEDIYMSSEELEDELARLAKQHNKNRDNDIWVSLDQLRGNEERKENQKEDIYMSTDELNPILEQLNKQQNANSVFDTGLPGNRPEQSTAPNDRNIFDIPNNQTQYRNPNELGKPSSPEPPELPKKNNVKQDPIYQNINPTSDNPPPVPPRKESLNKDSIYQNINPITQDPNSPPLPPKAMKAAQQIVGDLSLKTATGTDVSADNIPNQAKKENQSLGR